MKILGVSALYHDSAACIVRDGEIVAAAQEERFSRKKHDAGIPHNAIRYCLKEAGVGAEGVDFLVFYDKPLTKLIRLIETYREVAPKGLRSFLMAIPAWLKEKAFVPYYLERSLRDSDCGRPGRVLFTEHHVSHAASAFYPSPFSEAAIVTLDGVGEWTTTAIGIGMGNRIKLILEHRFPHSLGLLYSAFTYFTGFKVNSGEYKLMGLAPYGDPVYVDTIKENLLDIREDGSFRLNMKYFGYLDGFTMTSPRFNSLFGGPPRRPETEITKREMDLARSIQDVLEEIVLKISRYARALTGMKHLCLAGGVALNCVANGKILRSGLFDDIWIQPAAGDAGGALGSALHVWYDILDNARKTGVKLITIGSRNTVGGGEVHGGRTDSISGTSMEEDSMAGSLLGPSFKSDDIGAFLDLNGFPYRRIDKEDKRARLVAEAVSEEKVIGLFQGRMEFGPRALCNRSILADARSRKMQSYLNLATKFRESFRPFAPVVLEEDTKSYFSLGHKSPYMLLVDEVLPERRVPGDVDRRSVSLKEWVNTVRSDIPAVTHVDYSSRLQTVSRRQNPFMHRILREFKELTGYSVMVNTSFNVRGEPIVCTPEDAYRCFMRTGIDILVLDEYVLYKEEQPAWEEASDWKEEFTLD